MIWLLLFIALPAAELALLIEFGSRFGTLNTLAVIVLTGMLGAALTRTQGLKVLREIQRETAEGRLPAGSLVDGLVILVAGALLITPGILTDVFGFLCLVPALRGLAKAAARRWLERAVRENRVEVRMHVEGMPPAHGPVIDVDPQPREPDSSGGKPGGSGLSGR